MRKILGFLLPLVVLAVATVAFYPEIAVAGRIVADYDVWTYFYPLRQYGEPVLASGRDLMVVSAGAFSDDGLLERLQAAARAAGRQILIPSGAMAKPWIWVTSLAARSSIGILSPVSSVRSSVEIGAAT